MNELKQNDIVIAHGAKFRLQTDAQIAHHPLDTPCYWCKGTWISGRIEPGYFGPDQDWTFQGTEAVIHQVED